MTYFLKVGILPESTLANFNNTTMKTKIEKIIEKYEKDKYVVLHSSNITNMLLIALYNPFTKKRIIIKQKDKIITIKVT